MSQTKKGVFSVFKQEGNQRQAPFYCRWTEDEDKLLYEAVQLHGPHKWSLIARHVPGRTPVQCSTRWLGALNPHVHKGRWSKEEDEALTAAVGPYLKNNNNKASSSPISLNSTSSASTASTSETEEDNLPWSKIALNIPNRTGIQCQARWTEALDPSVRKGRWKKEEDNLLKIGVERYGCCWIRVAGFIPGRTQRQCRTRWNQIQSKRQKKTSMSSAPSTSTALAIQQQHANNKKLALKADQQKSIQQKRKSEHAQEILQWKTYSAIKGNMEDQHIKPIQLSTTPYILLNEQSSSSVGHNNLNAATSPVSNAIVIPSNIQSPLQSPSTISSGLSSMDEDEFTESTLEDYFHSLTDVIKVEGYDSNSDKATNNNLSAMDAVQLLDNFDNMTIPTTANTTIGNSQSLLNDFLYNQQPDPLSFFSLYEFLQSPATNISTNATLPSLILDNYINIPNSTTSNS